MFHVISTYCTCIYIYYVYLLILSKTVTFCQNCPHIYYFCISLYFLLKLLYSCYSLYFHSAILTIHTDVHTVSHMYIHEHIFVCAYHPIYLYLLICTRYNWVEVLGNLVLDTSH